MRTISAVLALAAVACVAAFPTKFYSVSHYATTTCTGTISSTEYYGLDQCIVNQGNTGTLSVKYTETTATPPAVVTTQYTANKDCTGANSVNNRTYVDAQCDASGSSSVKYAFPASGTFWGRTQWANGDCSGIPDSGPSFNPFSQCLGGGGQSATYEQKGSKITICQFAGNTCAGDATTCNDISQGECFVQSSTVSLKFEFNSASAHAPQFLVAAAAVLMAFASFRM